MIYDWFTFCGALNDDGPMAQILEYLVLSEEG